VINILISLYNDELSNKFESIKINFNGVFDLLKNKGFAMIPPIVLYLIVRLFSGLDKLEKRNVRKLKFLSH